MCYFDQLSRELKVFCFFVLPAFMLTNRKMRWPFVA